MLLGAVAGVVAGVALTGLLFLTGSLERTAVVTGEQAAEDLVVAWKRSRVATYALDGTFERRRHGVGVLESAVFEAQRPPDRIRRSLGGVEGVLSGRSVLCSSGPDGSFRCAPTGPTRDHDAEVAADVERLRSYLTSDPPLYTVARDGECFLLQQRVVTVDPPFGRRAAMCFDGETGALRFLRVETPDVIDTFEATTIRVVDDSDFVLEADTDFAPRTRLDTTTSTTPAPDDGSTSTTTTLPNDAAGLFERCHDGGGSREVHAALFDLGTSINDPRWWDDDGSIGACALRGTLYYLERVG